MEKTVKEYQESTDKGLINFVQDIKSGALGNPSAQNYSVGPVSNRTAIDIDNLTGIDVTGYTHNIKGNAVEHIENRHGKNGEHDHSMTDINDLGRIGYVLENYDNVGLLYRRDGVIERSSEFRSSNGEFAPLIIYEKRVNGTYYAVEAVPDAKAKKLQVVSAYIRKAKKGEGQALNMATKAPQVTSEAPVAASPDNPK